MINERLSWEKFGKIIGPRKDISWMQSHVSSLGVLQIAPFFYELYITGRDIKNRSRIGKIGLTLSPNPFVTTPSALPVLDLGELGTFDESGTSYPCLVKNGSRIFMYYTGWTPTVKTPFQNHVGLAEKVGNKFKRVSRAPILDRTNEEPFCTGSVFVMKESDYWSMWYTSFTKWEEDARGKICHFYNIKYARSLDGIDWVRNNQVCIDYSTQNEFAICRPSVIFLNNVYHMLFCYRGESYKLGYAYSKDGVTDWIRDDKALKISLSDSGFDSEEMCYPTVFKNHDFLYLAYSGNNFGNSGIGLARLRLKN